MGSRPPASIRQRRRNTDPNQTPSGGAPRRLPTSGQRRPGSSVGPFGATSADQQFYAQRPPGCRSDLALSVRRAGDLAGVTAPGHDSLKTRATLPKALCRAVARCAGDFAGVTVPGRQDYYVDFFTFAIFAETRAA